MGTLSAANVRTLMDSVASAKLIFDAAVGATSSTANTVAKAAANDVATITAVADNDVQSDLAWWFRLRAQQTVASSLYTSLGAYNVWVALEKHVGGLDTFLRTNNIRVAEDCKTLGFPLSAEQLLSPVVDPMATFATTGSGAGTYTHVADIDTTRYGRAWLEVVVTSSSGLSASQITATVSGKQFDAVTTVSKQAVLTAASSFGKVVALGTVGVQADSYDFVTGISITGGSNGDAFKVRSVVERAITATS